MSLLDFFKTVDINKEVNRCRTTKGAVLLDVRTEEEYRSGHISGSRNIPVAKIDNAANQVEYRLRARRFRAMI